MGDNTYKPMRMEALVEIKKTFQSPSINSKGVIYDESYGLDKDRIEGIVELWWKRSETNLKKPYMIESTTYNSIKNRKKIIDFWKQKYLIHVYPKNLCVIVIPDMPIDEENYENTYEYTEKRPPAIYTNARPYDFDAV